MPVQIQSEPVKRIEVDAQESAAANEAYNNALIALRAYFAAISSLSEEMQAMECEKGAEYAFFVAAVRREKNGGHSTMMTTFSPFAGTRTEPSPVFQVMMQAFAGLLPVYVQRAVNAYDEAASVVYTMAEHFGIDDVKLETPTEPKLDD